MTDQDEREIRERIAPLRAHDEASAPEFRAMWDRAAAVPARAPRARFEPNSRMVAAAAAVLIITGSTMVWLGAPAASPEPETSVTAWRAPTDALLNITGRELFAPPSITTSVIDRYIPKSTVFKGD